MLYDLDSNINNNNIRCVGYECKERSVYLFLKLFSVYI